MAFYQTYSQNKIKALVFALLFVTATLPAQINDSLADIYGKYMPSCHADELYAQLRQSGFSNRRILGIGSFLMYSGKDACGDAIMREAIQRSDTVKAPQWHMYSVQNTKNGNYANGFEGFTKAVNMSAKDNQGYAGWVLLYYYRDYRRALQNLIAYDAFTPGVPDFPVGENLDFLKGLCYYNLGQPDSAYTCFHKEMDWIVKDRGREAVNSFSYFYAARCLDKLGKTKQALSEYSEAIALDHYPVEALYYAGLLYKRSDREKAKEYLTQALELSKKGYKQQDIYVELFDEVYLSQIEEALDELTKK